MARITIPEATVISVNAAETPRNVKHAKLRFETKRVERGKDKQFHDVFECFDVTVWGRLGESALGLKEGARIMLEVELTSREYQGKWYMDLRVYSIAIIKPLVVFGEAAPKQSAPVQPANSSQSAPALPDAPEEDDLPF